MKTSFRHTLVLLFLVALGVTLGLGGWQLGAQEAAASSDFYEQLQRIRSIEQLKSYLDVDDPQKARLVIIRMVDLDKLAALPILRALWERREPSHTIEHMSTYEHPIARLTLAEQLMAISPSSEYGHYVKRAADQDNWIVQSMAAEALAAVDDSEAVELLAHIARSEKPFVAESAIASLSRIARYGKHAAEAERAIEALHGDRRIEHGRVGNKASEANQQSEAQSRKPTDVTTNQARLLDEQIQPYLVKEQYQDAINILLPVAKDGSAHAQHLAGELYLAINPPDYDSAREWLQKAVMQDYAPAKTSLANLYLNGRGVEKNEAEAVRLLREAEQQGDQSAHILLEKARKHGWQ